ncbi:hypothetical protein [Nereida ignava]|uniref:Uncharacterized protein n=1 Tax=Nereida ignava TaxID=282199 RepID=A0A0U1NMV5_9RHOB|nr:hypothetical protein [Nereida ignava]CRK76037.1 hypothetical protein NIG5292_02094 [Nereida ignava]SFJ66284.1 hypothetical protein SAMN02745667_01940 [Nereida ignava DSM 16309]
MTAHPKWIKRLIAASETAQHHQMPWSRSSKKARLSEPRQATPTSSSLASERMKTAA